MLNEFLLRQLLGQFSHLEPTPEEVAPGVHRLGIVFVNVYFIEDRSGDWVLVDTGLPFASSLVRRGAEAIFGRRARPRAIILTHGHFDHAGNAEALSDEWRVPVIAHRAELPFLDGRSDYPPQDPSMGGAIATLARVFPHEGYDLRPNVKPLPADGQVPFLSEWRWVHTPGHTPGHVSLFRESDRVLLAGDAVATMDLDSYTQQVARQRELNRPPVPFTPDWQATRESIERLAELRPEVIAAGHGLPIDQDAAEELEDFVGHVEVPEDGRYWPEAARFDDERGTVWVPPPVADPIGTSLRWGGAAAAALAVAAVLAMPRKS